MTPTPLAPPPKSIPLQMKPRGKEFGTRRANQQVRRNNLGKIIKSVEHKNTTLKPKDGDVKFDPIKKH